MKSSADHDALLAEVASYYSDKISEFGETAQGVDWNSTASQELRFDQLVKVIDAADAFSLNDLGCGYGALLDYLNARYTEFSYAGFDVSAKMIERANERVQKSGKAVFLTRDTPDRVADYGVASGIFNVRQEQSADDWRAYVEDCLAVLHETSRLGFSFNCLTSYSDADKMKDYLYYADPRDLFDLCKRRFSRNIALLHDYNLYEFTILVRKQP